MNRQYLVVTAVAGLLLAFALATYVYTSEQSDRIAALAVTAPIATLTAVGVSRTSMSDHTGSMVRRNSRNR